MVLWSGGGGRRRQGAINHFRKVNFWIYLLYGLVLRICSCATKDLHSAHLYCRNDPDTLSESLTCWRTILFFFIFLSAFCDYSIIDLHLLLLLQCPSLLHAPSSEQGTRGQFPIRLSSDYFMASSFTTVPTGLKL